MGGNGCVDLSSHPGVTMIRTIRLLLFRWRNDRRTRQLTPGTLERPKKWGIWDRDEKCWMGSSDGPLTYGPHWVARLAARLMAARLDYSPLSIQVKRYPKQKVSKKDDIRPAYSAEEAFRRIEEGLML